MDQKSANIYIYYEAESQRVDQVAHHVFGVKTERKREKLTDSRDGT